MRATLTKSQVDQLSIVDGIDRHRLPKPRPDSKIAAAAVTAITANDETTNRTTIRPAPVSPAPDVHYSRPRKGPDGVLFVVIAIIVFLIILLVLSTKSHGEQVYVLPVLSMPDSLSNGYPPPNRFVPGIKPTDAVNPILTNILNKMERMDRRIDAMVKDNDYTARRNQNQTSSIDRRISAVSSASVEAVVEGTEAISNCLIQTHLRTVSSLNGIHDTQDSIITSLAGIRDFIVAVLTVLVLFGAMVLNRFYPHALRSLRRPFQTGTPKAVSPISTQLTTALDYRHTVPPPDETLVRLLRSTHDNADLQIKPSVSPIGWRGGFRSDKGPYRTNNQDYGCLFGIGDKAVAGVADGVAGLPAGADASCCAITAASSHLAYYLGRNPTEDELPDILHHAVLSASHALTGKALRDNMHGMRTTLALVIATPKNYYAESIGDSKFIVVRKDGKVEVLVEPQRVPGAPLNELAASLGPVIDGDPQSSSLPVLSGDLLIGGSDGLWNIVDDEFPQAIIAAVQQFNGDLQLIADTVLANLVEETDPLRLPCRDNLTIALAYRDDIQGGNHV